MTARGARAAGAGCLNFGKQKLELSVFKWEVQFHFFVPHQMRIYNKYFEHIILLHNIII